MSQSIVRVFVSSTWIDLQPERAAVEKALHRMRETEFNGMEYFGSRGETTRQASLGEVDRSDVYIGIFGGRYGSGITEDEYRRACELGLECKIYFKADGTITWLDDELELKTRLAALKEELRRSHLVSTFHTSDELAYQIAADLHSWIIGEHLPKTRLLWNALHQLPPPPSDFTGREDELRELEEKLGHGVTISGLQGLGGVGKTALALKLAEQIKDRYPDAQFYLDLQGAGASPLTTADAMRHVIRAYHPTEVLPESLSELSAFYRSVLHDRPALLLMDNARDRQQVEPLVPPAGCVMLVTSRQHFTLPGMHARNLDALPRADSVKLLLGVAERIGDHADEIARLCGDLPLALRVTGSAIAERVNLTPAGYARRLGDARQRLRHLAEVDAALSVSYEMLEEEQQRWWRVLAVFPATFDDAAAGMVWGVALDDAAAYSVLGMAPDDAQDALGDLMKWSLVEFNAETNRYRLHDLARLFAAARLTEAGESEESLARQLFAFHYLAVLNDCNSLYQEGHESATRGLALLDQEWSNIQAGQTWATAWAEKVHFAAQLCVEYPNLGRDVLPLRQPPRQRIHWLEAQLAAARQLKQREAEAEALGRLGLAWSALGEPRKAIGFHEQELAIVREVGDRRGEGRVLGKLGLAYHALDEAHEAIEFYEQCLAITREVGDRSAEGFTLGNLGLAWSALGEHHKAIEFHEQYLAIAREIGNLRSASQAFLNLGEAWLNLGEANKAIGFLEQRIAIAREIGDREHEGDAFGYLGVAWSDLGEPRKAVESHEQHLAIAREIGDHDGEGKALSNLGNAWADLGEMSKATRFYEQWLAIARETGDRRGEGDALWNLSLSLDDLGERERVVALAEAAAEIYEAIESPRAEEVRDQLAEWRGQEARHDEQDDAS